MTRSNNQEQDNSSGFLAQHRPREAANDEELFDTWPHSMLSGRVLKVDALDAKIKVYYEGVVRGVLCHRVAWARPMNGHSRRAFYDERQKAEKAIEFTSPPSAPALPDTGAEVMLIYHNGGIVFGRFSILDGHRMRTQAYPSSS